MGLENLKSVFQDELESKVDNFISNRIDNVNQSNFLNRDLPNRPLDELGISFMNGLSWEKLYNDDHTPLSNPNHQGIVPISYENVSRDNLKIGKRTPNIQQHGLGRGDEPYIVSKIGDSGRDRNSGGRFFSPLSRALTDGDRIIQYLTSASGLTFILKQNINVPIQNTVIRKNGSLERVSQRYGVVYNPLSTILSTSARVVGQGLPNVLFRKQGGGAIAEALSGWEQFKPGGSADGNSEARADAITDLFTPSVYGASATDAGFSINDTFTKAGDNQTGIGNGFLSQLQSAASSLNPFGGGTTVPKTITGDKMTLAKMIKGDSLAIDTSFGTSTVGNTTFGQVIPINIDSAENGMPFYFKDLRDNTYIFFRAYIEGLTENISPSYAPHNYIGRSEPVYTYERGEREISFTLKLVAQTKSELKEIYIKMDRLTSLCYPQYINEGEDGYGNRMKPPLAKLRMGELFGKTNKELMGYIKSISYSVEETSTYETEVGKRVPRHVTATIGYQVIHDRAPRLGTTFYGINETDADNTDAGGPGGFQDSSPIATGEGALGQESFY